VARRTNNKSGLIAKFCKNDYVWPGSQNNELGLLIWKREDQ